MVKAKYYMWSACWLGFIIIATIFFLFDDENVLVSGALAYAALIGCFLGLDIAKTVTRTLDKPKGEFEQVKLLRYLFGILTTLFLLGITFFKETEKSSAISALIPCIMTPLVAIVNAYGANKTLTSKTTIK